MKKIYAPNINALWSALLMEELHRQNVRYIGVAPGSRSTPLALAAAAHPGLQLMVHLDERALAFHALGWARATGRPAVVLTTSGTAVANLAPAVAEAALDHVPLILLTADRPPELRDTAANQTMDQVKIFGSGLRWQFDLPCPSADLPLAMLLTTVDQAVARASLETPGPVHLNCMFREPLAPVLAKYPRSRLLQPLKGWLQSGLPLTNYQVNKSGTAGHLPAALRAARRGLVVAGALSPDEAEAAVALARHLQWPLLPDLQSGLRLGANDDSVIAHADLVLTEADGAAAFKPDFVLVLGGRVTSKRLAALLQTGNAVPVLRVTPWLDRQDPAHALSVQWLGSVVDFAAAVQFEGHAAQTGWLAGWQKAQRRVADRLSLVLGGTGPLHEPKVAWELTRRLPADHALFAGNSLPIRLLDTFASSAGPRAPVAANRGVSGIDGLLATATGYAAGRGQPVTLLIGDLSLLHDLNSLLLLRASKVPVVVVVVNNDGGGIFSFLPVAGRTPDFEKVFGLPHGCTFAGAAAMFGLPYKKVSTMAAFTRAYRLACRSNQSAVLEVTTDRHTTREAWRAVQAALAT